MKLLIAEDEKQMSRAESAFFTMRGYQVDIAQNGAEAVELARRNAYDVMVLDIMMPQKDGIAALEEIRGAGNTTPVIMLTAKAELDDRITGLSAGADDYLTKPFSLRELEARIQAQIRRSERFAVRQLSYRSVTLREGEQELSCRNAVRLSGMEVRLLAHLMRNAEKAIPTQELLLHVWGKEENASAEMVELYLSYLRQKLRAVGADAEIREDAPGQYRLCGIEAKP